MQKKLIFDGNDGKELKFTKVFGAAAALSRIIRKEDKIESSRHRITSRKRWTSCEPHSSSFW